MTGIFRGYRVGFPVCDCEFEPASLVCSELSRRTSLAFIFDINACLKKSTLGQLGPFYWEHDGTQNDHCRIVLHFLLYLMIMGQLQVDDINISRIRKYGITFI